MQKTNKIPLNPTLLEACCRFEKEYQPVLSRERDEEHIPQKEKEESARRFLALCKELDLNPKAVASEKAKELIEKTARDYPQKGVNLDRISYTKEEFDSRISALSDFKRCCEILNVAPKEIIIKEAAAILRHGQLPRRQNLEVEISQLTKNLYQEKIREVAHYKERFRVGRMTECWYVFPRFLEVEDGKVVKVIY
jgi:hypothetical protein